MIRFIRCFIWVLGAAVMVPTACPALHNCWTVFPLPSGLKVGQRWTYLGISEQLDLNSDAILGSSTDTLTISVVSRRQVGDRIYFMLSDSQGHNGLYRVDGSSRTWRYDVERGTEELCWDIWGPPSYESDRDLIVFEGSPPLSFDDVWFTRSGPYELRDLSPDSRYGVPDQDAWLETLRDWEANTLNNFSIDIYESAISMVFSYSVGVLLYYSGGWEFDSTRILLSYEPGDSEQIDTRVEDVSFGEIKEQMRRLRRRQP